MKRVLSQMKTVYVAAKACVGLLEGVGGAKDVSDLPVWDNDISAIDNTAQMIPGIWE